MSEKPHNRITHGIRMREPIDLCEGYEEELNGIMARMLNEKREPLSAEEYATLTERAEFLNDALDERNRRLDSVGGPVWQGMKGR